MPRLFFHTTALNGRTWARRLWLTCSILISAAVLVLLSLDMPIAV
jgi:hypothetical protein